jgi:hypothetical protein
MPKRTTPLQAIVHLVRQHYAQPGVTVTESKLLHDHVLGTDREVDIVIEGEVDGEPIVVSLEVNERSRPVAVPWVQEQIAKHRRLPTNRLVLVSKSGFSRTALSEVRAQGGWVEAVRAEVEMVDGQPVVQRLFLESIFYRPTQCRLELTSSEAETVSVAGMRDVDIYAAPGSLIGSLAELVLESLLLPTVGNGLATLAYNPSRVRATTFELRIPVATLGYHLENEIGVLRLISVLRIKGGYGFEQHEIELTRMNLGARVFGAGQATFMGRAGVWVETTDPRSGHYRLSWQSISPAVTAANSEKRESIFPGLLGLIGLTK